MAGAGGRRSLAVVAAFVAMRLAGDRTLARPVLALLRRVPERGTLARRRWPRASWSRSPAASLVAAVSDQTAPLALLAPALLAVVAGILTARLLGLWARVRMPAAHPPGQDPGAARPRAAVPAAGRQPADPRGDRRGRRCCRSPRPPGTSPRRPDGTSRPTPSAPTGSCRSCAAHPAALVSAVAAADPGGHAMSVVRATERYGDATVELLGVQTERLADVAVWRGHDEAELADLAETAAAADGTAAHPGPAGSDRRRRRGGVGHAEARRARSRPRVSRVRSGDPRHAGAGSAHLRRRTIGVRRRMPAPGSRGHPRPHRCRARRRPVADRRHHDRIGRAVAAAFDADGRWRASTGRVPRATVRASRPARSSRSS